MTFTTRNGTKFEVLSSSTYTAPNGNLVSKNLVNTYNPKTGHGWQGIMDDAELAAWRGR